MTRSPFPSPPRERGRRPGRGRIPVGDLLLCAPGLGRLPVPTATWELGGGRERVRLDSASFLPPSPGRFVTAAPALPRSCGRGGHRLLQNSPGGSSSACPAASLST